MGNTEFAIGAFVPEGEYCENEEYPAISMGNFSVTERYSISLCNTTNKGKIVSYYIGGDSSMFFRTYVDGKDTSGFRGDNVAIVGEECFLLDEIVAVTLEPFETKTIVVEIVIPNIGDAGVYNMLRVEDRGGE